MSKIDEFVTSYEDDELYVMIPLGTKKRDVGKIAAEKMLIDIRKYVEKVQFGKGATPKDIDAIKRITSKINRIIG